MNFKIKTNTLLKALIKVNRFVNAKSTIDSLNGINFELSTDSLTIIGSDSTVSMRCTIDTDLTVLNKGTVTLPKIIVEIIRKIQDEFINIALIDNNVVMIHSTNTEFKLNSIDSNTFPRIDFTLTEDVITLKTNDLIDITNQTIFACSHEELRPQLTGVNFIFNGTELSCFSTDSFRLSKKKIILDGEYHYNIIVPAKCLSEVSKIIERDDEVNIYITKQKIIFEFANQLIQSRLINALFPAIPINSDFSINLLINRLDFIHALERASIMSVNSNSGHNVNLELKEGRLFLNAKSPEIGSIVEEIKIIKPLDNEFSFSFSTKYMLDALKVLNASEIIHLGIVAPMNPFILKNENIESLVQLIVPVRTH